MFWPQHFCFSWLPNILVKRTNNVYILGILIIAKPFVLSQTHINWLWVVSGYLATDCKQWIFETEEASVGQVDIFGFTIRDVCIVFNWWIANITSASVDIYSHPENGWFDVVSVAEITFHASLLTAIERTRKLSLWASNALWVVCRLFIFLTVIMEL